MPRVLHRYPRIRAGRPLRRATGLFYLFYPWVVEHGLVHVPIHVFVGWLKGEGERLDTFFEAQEHGV